MPVLTIASRKGGCGKTTVATSLAAALVAQGVPVALLDADPNASAYRWATTTYAGAGRLAAYAEADKDKLADLLPALAEQHPVLIADTAGFGNQSATLCMLGADAILVLVTPGEADVVEAGRTMAFVEGLARSARRPLPARVLANRVRRTTTLSRHMITQIEALGLPRLRTVLSEAVGYGELGFSGTAPAPGTTAADEVAELLAELRALGWIPGIRAYTHT